MNKQLYKRQYRELDYDTKMKISASSRNKPKSERTKELIRQSMLHYWSTVPSRDDAQWDNNTNVNDDENKN